MHQRQDEPLSERREHHAGEQALRHRRAPRKVDPQADASQVREQRERRQEGSARVQVGHVCLAAGAAEEEDEGDLLKTRWRRR